jgi:hypothetical protein
MRRPPSFADIDAALVALGPEARRRRPGRTTLKELAEARRLLALAEPLRDRLVQLQGFEPAALERLPDLIERTFQAEITLTNERTKKGQRSLRRVREEAVSLRSRLATAAKRVCCDDVSLRGQLKGLHRQRTYAILVGDLKRLADLVDERPEMLSAVPGLPDNSARAARELAQKLIEGAPASGFRKALGDRNALTALLVAAVHEVRAGGRFLFRWDEEMLERFADPEERSKRVSRKARSDQDQEEEQD